jgi:multicomponent K+:H+ antiporter subunit D
VGAYIVLRLSLLLFGPGAGESAGFGEAMLLFGGMATIAFGSVGMLASQEMTRLAAFAVLVSSGTVLAATGFGQAGVAAGALFYLVSSTLALSALFLLVELAERGREPAAEVLAVTRELYDQEEQIDEAEESGASIPGTMGVLGIAFIACSLVIAGLPPFSGFIAKLALLDAILGARGAAAISTPAATLLIVVIGSGVTSVIAMSRAGIHLFWASPERALPRVRIVEIAPIAVLLFLCALQTVLAGPLMRYMTDAAQALHHPDAYIGSVLGAPRP